MHLSKKAALFLLVALTVALVMLSLQPVHAESGTGEPPITHTLAVGWTGPEVSALQEILSNLSLFTGEITGYFGSLTQQAVLAFQKQNNLAAVGIVGPRTRVVLAAAAVAQKTSTVQASIGVPTSQPDKYAQIDGYDSNGISNAVNQEIKDTGTSNVIVTMKLPFSHYYDKQDSATTRASKNSQFNAAKSAIAAAMGKGGKITRDLPIINGLAITVNANALNGLAHSPTVQKVDPDLKVQAFLDQSTATTNAPSAWSLTDAKGNALTGIGERIAIIDTGVDYTRPDLGGCFGAGCKVEGGYDFVNLDTDPTDDMGHGTHVAATAAGVGQVGTTRLYGIAPGAHILAYKVLNSGGSGLSSNIIAGINRAVDPNNDGNSADHADVISMSLGRSCGSTYTTSCGPADSTSVAVDNATAAGVISAIAAGNSGPALSTVGSPATAATAVTVAAGCAPHGILRTSSCGSTGTDPIASFSSRGPVVYNGIDYKKPDVTAPGVMICAARWGTSFSTSPTCFDSNHIRISGTSMAAPHVTGALAILRQLHPTYTPSQIKNLIKVSATDLGNGLTYNDEGKGLINVSGALTIPPPPVTLTVCPSFSSSVGCVSNDDSLSLAYNTFIGASWSSTNIPATATACSYTGPDGKAVSAGPQNPAPGWGGYVTGAGDIKLVCTDSSGTVRSAVVHVILKASSVTLTVCPSFSSSVGCVTNGGSITAANNTFIGASWSSVNIPATATACSYTGPDGTTVSAGPQNPAPGWGGYVTGTRDVTLTCTDIWGVVQSARVTVTIPPPPPANDNFGSAQVLTGSSGTTVGSTVSATHETGEPYNCNWIGGHSIWYAWTPTQSGTATVNTFGSTFDTTLGVYTGSSVSSLTSKGCNDDSGGSLTLQSQVSFSAVAGTSYHISIDGYSSAVGSTKLSWSVTTPPGSNISISTDPSSPSYAIAAGGTTNVVMGVAKFRASGEAANLTKIGLTLANGTYSGASAGQDIQNVYIYQGSTFVGATSFVGNAMTATSTITPVNLPKDSDTILTIKTDLTPICGSCSGTAGDLVKIDVANFEATGASSGGVIRGGASRGLTSFAGMRIFRSFPTVSGPVTLPSTTLVSGSNPLLRFKVVANSSGGIGIRGFSFNVVPSNVSVGTISLYAFSDQTYTTPIGGFAGGFIGRTGVLSGDYITPTPTQTLEIPAGSIYYFELRGATSNMLANASVVSTLVGDSVYSPLTDLNHTYTAVGKFIWTPNDLATSSPDNLDWTNGYGVAGFPSSGITQTLTGNATPTGLSATCSFDGTATFSWKSVAGATGYPIRINYQANDNSSSSCIDTWYCATPPDFYNDNVSTTTYTQKGLTLDQPYSWWVHAIVGGVWSTPTGGPVFICGSGKGSLSTSAASQLPLSGAGVLR